MVRERADRTGGLVPVPTPTSLTVAELRQLVSLMDKSDIEEITIEHEGDGLRLTLRKPAPVVLDQTVMFATVDSLETTTLLIPEGASEADDDLVGALEVRSSLVGFYRAVAKRGAKSLERVIRSKKDRSLARSRRSMCSMRSNRQPLGVSGRFSWTMASRSNMGRC